MYTLAFREAESLQPPSILKEKEYVLFFRKAGLWFSVLQFLC